jgi:hypothetical protein
MGGGGRGRKEGRQSVDNVLNRCSSTAASHRPSHRNINLMEPFGPWSLINLLWAPMFKPFKEPRNRFPFTNSGSAVLTTVTPPPLVTTPREYSQERSFLLGWWNPLSHINRYHSHPQIPPLSTFIFLTRKQSQHGLINYKDTKPKISSLLVFNRVYRLEIQSVMLVF